VNRSTECSVGIDLCRYETCVPFEGIETSVTVGIEIQAVWNSVSIRIGGFPFDRIEDSVVIIVNIEVIWNGVSIRVREVTSSALRRRVFCCSECLTGGSCHYWHPVTINGSEKLPCDCVDICKFKHAITFDRIWTSVTIGVFVLMVWNGVSVKVICSFYGIEDAIIVIIKVIGIDDGVTIIVFTRRLHEAHVVCVTYLLTAIRYERNTICINSSKKASVIVEVNIGEVSCTFHGIWTSVIIGI